MTNFITEKFEETDEYDKTKDLTSETFEDADAYDKRSDQQYHCGLQLIRELGIKHGSTVLDIGAGPGRLALHVAGLIGKEGLCFGIDRSHERIKIAKRRAESRQISNLAFATGNGTNLSRFIDGFFDTVYLNSAFHWFNEQNRLLQEVHRVLKPGGRLGFTSQISNYPERDLREIGDSFLKKKRVDTSALSQSSYSVTIDEARELLDQAGFRVLRLELRPSIEDLETPEDAINDILKKRYKNLSSSQKEELRNELIKESKKIEIDGKIKVVRDKLIAIAEKGDTSKAIAAGS